MRLLRLVEAEFLFVLYLYTYVIIFRDNNMIEQPAKVRNRKVPGHPLVLAFRVVGRFFLLPLSFSYSTLLSVLLPTFARAHKHVLAGATLYCHRISDAQAQHRVLTNRAHRAHLHSVSLQCASVLQRRKPHHARP